MAGRYDRVNGIYSKVNKRFDKVNGIWQPVKKRYDKANGMWQTSFTSGIPVSITTVFEDTSTDPPSYSCVNTSDSNNFSFYGYIGYTHANQRYSGVAHAYVYFEVPTANACSQGSNILAINGTAIRVQSGTYADKSSYGGDSNTEVAMQLFGMKNQTTFGYMCSSGRYFLLGQSAGTTTSAINSTASLTYRGSDTIIGFRADFEIFMFTLPEYSPETVSFSIPWSAFTYLPTGEHLAYNP